MVGSHDAKHVIGDFHPGHVVKLHLATICFGANFGARRDVLNGTNPSNQRSFIWCQAISGGFFPRQKKPSDTDRCVQCVDHRMRDRRKISCPFLLVANHFCNNRYSTWLMFSKGATVFVDMENISKVISGSWLLKIDSISNSNVHPFVLHCYVFSMFFQHFFRIYVFIILGGTFNRKS